MLFVFLKWFVRPYFMCYSTPYHRPLQSLAIQRYWGTFMPLRNYLCDHFVCPISGLCCAYSSSMPYSITLGLAHLSVFVNDFTIAELSARPFSACHPTGLICSLYLYRICLTLGPCTVLMNVFASMTLFKRFILVIRLTSFLFRSLFLSY